MITWPQLLHDHPDIADPGLRLLYPAQAGVGLAYLSTVRADGGPRVHPMCPISNGNGLFALIVPGPKRGDLLRDGRYALHSFPTDDNEDAFYLTGRATPVEQTEVIDSVVTQFLDERRSFGLTEESIADHLPFEFRIDTAMLTRTAGHGDPHPEHVVWRHGAVV